MKKLFFASLIVISFVFYIFYKYENKETEKQYSKIISVATNSDTTHFVYKNLSTENKISLKRVLDSMSKEGIEYVDFNLENY